MLDILSEKVKGAVEELYGKSIEGFKVEKPREESFGDYATNVAFLLAKELRRSPVDIARELSEELEKDSTFERVNPERGFINFFLSKDFLIEELRVLLREGEEYFREDLGRGQKVQVEFVSANPTGPLHLGHGRGAVVGDALSRLLDFYGYEVVREFYINDAGRQVYILGVSVLYRYLELFGREDEYPEIERVFREEGYKGGYVIEIAESIKSVVGDALLRGGVSEAYEKLLSHGFGFPLEYTRRLKGLDFGAVELCTAFGLDAMLYEIREDLKNINITFDVWYSEKSLYEKGLVDSLIDELRNKGYVYEKEGALWLKTSEAGDDKDRVVKKSDGSYTYFASDIAYHYDKFKRGFDRVIDVWGADHHGYIPRLKAVLKILGISPEWLEVCLIQMVRLFKEGKEQKMSKRAGNFVPLGSLVEEVGQDAVRFSFLTKRSDTPLDIDVEKIKEKSSDNPVFYVQYAHARICGVFREYEKRYGEKVENIPLEFVDGLGEEAEFKLIKKLLGMKDELISAVLKREPHTITYLLIATAGLFHNYYNHHRILGMEEKIMKSRLLLLKALRIFIRLGLKLIGVSAPERM